ncbi:MAG: hypothetical protein HY328_11840 [Chloroflexi bacterium]|nr:hypothetical protein [Chloroflexota bacterium]
MAKSMQVSWQVLLEDDEWAQADGTSWPASSGTERETERRRRRRWADFGLMLLALAAVTLWGWQNGLGSSSRAQSEIAQAITSSGGGDAGNRLPIRAADVLAVELRGDQALAQVRVADADSGLSYRETRFFQRTVHGWQPVDPIDDFWGSAQQQTSDFFIFHFRQRDGATIAAVAPQLDEHYRRVRRWLGLVSPPTEGKIAVRVVGPQGLAEFRTGRVRTLTVASPSLQSLPADLSEADALLHALLSSLIDEAVTAALLRLLHSEWQVSSGMSEGLRLWLRWESGLADATARRAQVRRSYEPLAEAGSALHSGLSPRLADVSLSINPRDYREESLTQIRQSAVATATLLEYATRRYGSGRVAVLLAKLSHLMTWQTLIPAVFDVPAEEFEAGWRAWLAQEYGVNL